MTRAIRWALWRLLAAIAVACAGGETAPGKDTVPPEPSPAGGRRAAGRRTWAWDNLAGTYFAVPGANGSTARLVLPSWSADQALDSLVPSEWSAEGASVDVMAGATLLGGARLTEIRIDSLCVGWPSARLGPAGAQGVASSWRVAFPPGMVEGIAFDSLPVLAPRDSADVTAEAARAASRLPGDTAAAFRGRPFVVRQANRFALDDGTAAALVEVVRLVPQEANPLQEQIVMILETAAAGVGGGQAAYHFRSIGLEEALSSLELVAVLRVKATGRLALLLRRDREGGFVLEWVERVAPGRWTVTWQSALDSC